MIERRLDHRAAGIGHQPECRFQPEHARPRCGQPDRAALVAADRHVGLAGGQDDGAAARGAARVMRRVVRIAHRPVVAGVSRSREREGLAIRRADDGAAGIENTRDDGCIEVGNKAFEQARSDRHRDAGDRHHVLDRHALSVEQPACRSLDVAAPVPAVARIIFALGPPAAVAGIRRVRLRLGKLLQSPVGIDRARHQRTVAVGFGGREIDPVIGRDLRQHRGARKIRPCRHACSIGLATGGVENWNAAIATSLTPGSAWMVRSLTLKNVMVYLVGLSGAGKLTVARRLALLLNARVVDNHWINNPIFDLLDNDRVTPFPTGVWDQVAKVRQAVLDTIATLSAPTRISF